MPHIDSEAQDFAGSKCFAVLDFCSGYWQLPVHSDSYGSCGIVCPNGVYSSTRVLPGLTNETCYFQSNVEPLFHEISGHMKAWLDDFKLHAANEADLLMFLGKLFTVCAERNLLFVSAKVQVRCTREQVVRSYYQHKRLLYGSLACRSTSRTELTHNC